ncbi:hypothetical protein BO82DRAFT_364987 [Aspergillus uvarum CBS 121591]|uniref:Uncharacterized protein n=1 Tax=Aspergillus uvarum CBS 121591 TaxID=1448315 RepID=A0A319CBL9_9EURO|nr:hypothetical protein BO82DRAFT_364987 [Aspergillus uvarum CBS 121591]PYH81549.1 hypothetical protein BO82DRAFT_364987 [Aspergillus uvarum CBS 121591]
MSCRSRIGLLQQVTLLIAKRELTGKEKLGPSPEYCTCRQVFPMKILGAVTVVEIRDIKGIDCIARIEGVQEEVYILCLASRMQLASGTTQTIAKLAQGHCEMTPQLLHDDTARPPETIGNIRRSIPTGVIAWREAALQTSPPPIPIMQGPSALAATRRFEWLHFPLSTMNQSKFALAA